MAHLTIYKDNYADATVVSNIFIDNYMKDANDAQLKVYFYLLRMMNANQAVSVSGIADKFNHTEKDVIRALKYWEKNHLLDLDYDADKNLVGVHLRDLQAAAGANALSMPAQAAAGISVPSGPAQDFADANVSYEAVQPAAGAPSDTGFCGAVRLPSADTDFSVGARVPADTDKPAFSKPSYSLDQLKEFKNREETAQLLFIAESYIGKPLTPSEIKTILFFTDELHFSEDLIDYLLQYCVDRGKKDFKYIEKVAVSWAEQNITTPRQAQKYAAKYDKGVYAIMNELGKNGSPTAKEMEYITRWTKEYGFSADIILEACERTVLATDRHRFEYAESILSSWKQENVHHKADIRRIDELYQKRKSASKPAANKFNQFTQNNYDFDELEREILSN